MLNFTVTVPDGSGNHGNPNLLCTPPQWFDYILFYFSNYFAHAATVITTPGQGRIETIHVILAALLLPVSGTIRAMEAIIRCSRAESDPLKRAVRAGALCMVVKAKHDKKREADPQSLEEGQAGVLQSKGEKPNPKNNPTETKGADQALEADIVPGDTVTSKPGCEAEEPRKRRVRTSSQTTRSSYMN